MIARAERRRASVEALANVGMALSKEIAVRLIDGPYHPEPRHDPGRSYAAASRSVRLTLTLEAKVDVQILALCSGDDVPNDAPLRRGPGASVEPAAGDEIGEPTSHPDADRENLVDRETPDVRPLPASPEVGRSDSRRPAASRVGGGRAAGSVVGVQECETPEHSAITPPRSRPDGGSRPPHFGGGRVPTSPDPPDLAQP